MTDKTDWIDLLSRCRIPAFEATDPEVADGVTQLDAEFARNGGSVLIISATKDSDDNNVGGYMGFYVSLRFDAQGRLLQFGIWE